MASPLEERGKSLEDEFFHKENKADLERFRAKLAKQSTKEDLRKASGMEDDAVLDKLVEMGLTADTVTALSLVPLLRVAWADGEMQDNEREAILQGARGKGIEDGSPGAELLSTWLDKKPDRQLYAAWAEYITALRSELTEEQSKILRTQVTRFALAVAESAGGFLGFGSVSKEEKDAMTWIESVFDEEVERKVKAEAESSDGDAEAKSDSSDGDAEAESDSSDGDGDGDGEAEAESDSSDGDAEAKSDSSDGESPDKSDDK